MKMESPKFLQPDPELPVPDYTGYTKMVEEERKKTQELAEEYQSAVTEKNSVESQSVEATSFSEEQSKRQSIGFGLENLKKLQEMADQVDGQDQNKSARMNELVRQLEFTQNTINGGGQMADGSDLSEYYQAKHDEFDSLAKEYEAHFEDVESLRRTAERAAAIDVVDPLKSARMAELAESLSSLQTFIRDGSKEDAYGVSLTERYKVKHDEFDSLAKELKVNIEDLSEVRQKAERVAGVDKEKSAQMQRLVDELQFLQKTVNGRGQMADGSDLTEHYKRKREELDAVMDEIGIKDINILDTTPTPKAVDDLPVTESDTPPVEAGIYATIDQVTNENEQLGVDNLESLVGDETLGELPEGFQKEVLPEQYAKENIEPSEHWQLKRAMREAKDAYLTKLDESAQKRGVLKKWIGFGRKNLDPEVQSAYDEFMAANKAYYQYANNSGRYDKIDAWLRSRQRASEGSKEVVGAFGAVAERHVFRPARERLALQEREMPSAVRKLFGKIAANPKLKWGLLGLSVVSTAGGSIAGMIAGKFTKWGLEKTYVKGKENEHQLDHEDIAEMIAAGEKVELDDLEELYYSSALAIDTARVRANVAGFAVGAAATTGVGYANWNDILSQSGVTGTEVVNQTPPTAEELGMVKPTETMTGQVPAQPEMVAVEAEPTIPVRTPEPTMVAPENVVENVTNSTETTIDTPSGTSEVSPTPENEVTTPVQVEDQDISAIDGDLSDSVTNYERPAVDGSNVESATTTENLVLDKIHISKDGNIGLVIPEGQTLDIDNVVGPFTEEASHTVEANQDLVDVMVNRLMEGVKAGKIELDPNMTEQDLRYMLLEKLPELKQPDEVLWFQRTANPGLSAEAWQEIGVPGGDPLNIPPGTEVDMEILLNEAMGFESDASTSIDTPVAPIEETGGSVELPKEVEQMSEQPLNQKVEFSVEEPAVGRTFATNETMITPRGEIFAARIDLDSARVAERLFGYQPQMSSELAKAVMTVGEGVNQNDFVRELYKQTLASYRAGDISLPVDVIRGVQSNPSAINAFIDRNAAEFAEFNPFITKRALDLTIDQWKDLGFSSGDPDKIMPGDTIQTGKLIKLILENAAGKINSKFHI
jgi:hypothetical protein